jgi:phosphoribosylformylglycinamidine cyclo-ligase
LVAKIDLGTWKFPKIFQWLQDSGKISQMDMLRIFNCGVGMVCVLDPKDAVKAQKILKKNNFKSFVLGTINKSQSVTKIEYI